MKNNARIVDRHQAEKLLRFINFVVDYIIIFLIQYLVLDYIIYSDFKHKIMAAFNYELFLWLLSIILYLAYYVSLEYFTMGRTIGKFITGTMVVNENGNLPNSNDFLKRNFSRIVPFDALSFLGSRGWHDSWSDTKVVKRKSYLEAVERENSIEDIGKIAL